MEMVHDDVAGYNHNDGRAYARISNKPMPLSESFTSARDPKYACWKKDGEWYNPSP